MALGDGGVSTAHDLRRRQRDLDLGNVAMPLLYVRSTHIANHCETRYDNDLTKEQQR
jgi:hypothetical protein